MGYRTLRGALLASCSLAAMIIGSGAPAAFAACVNGGGGYDNPAGTTISCVQVTNTTFTGNITNEGTISPGGIAFTGGVMTGFITDSGPLITGGISLDSNSKILSPTSGIQITGATFSGGINNSGTVSAGGSGNGILAYKVSNFSGGINNSGTVSAADFGIDVYRVSTFSGGITNSGSITSATRSGIWVGGSSAAHPMSTFSGGIINSGTISVTGANQNGIDLVDIANFSGGINNSGSISAHHAGAYDYGIYLWQVTDFSGGITNSGAISLVGKSAEGILVYGGSSFSGGITNSGNIVATGMDMGGMLVLGPSTFAGGITNSGTITAGYGIVAEKIGAFSGGITNSGNITALGYNTSPNGQTGHGIEVVGVSSFGGGVANSGTITAALDGIGVGPFSYNANKYGYVVSTFTGGIVNSGKITAGSTGIAVASVSTFSGGITNSGTISATSYYGIAVGPASHLWTNAGPVVAFSGGIANSGKITSLSTGIYVDKVSTFSGGVANSGTISVSAPAVRGVYGISVWEVSTFAGGITNSGAISLASQSAEGILVYSGSSFSGGITNSGSIVGTGMDVGGMLVLGPGTFAGGITNSGNITAGYGIVAEKIGAFSGGITNSGNITALGYNTSPNGQTGHGIEVVGVSSFGGGVANSGTITAALDGIGVGPFSYNANKYGYVVSTFTGGIVNSGKITAGSTGIAVASVTTFTGGITNSGTISATLGGIAVGVPSPLWTNASGVKTFSGGVTNSGSITGKTGIVVANVSTFSGDIANSGNITGTGGTAIDISNGNGKAITIDQLGGSINGAVKLSGNADILNVSGGAINGNIVGAGNDTINFAFGSGTFTYGYGFSGINQVNVNSGTVILDGTNQANNVAVNNGATLAGNGTIDALGTIVTVNSGGTLSPGTLGGYGTLTIDGVLAFNAGSTYTIQIAPGAGNNSKTAVNGTANLNGNGTVSVTPQLGHYSGAVYHIVTTTGGVHGTFAGTTVNGDFSGSATLDYATDPGNVDLDVTGASLLAPPTGANTNQQNVIAGINSGIFHSPANTPLPPGFLALGRLSNSALLSALNQFSGQDAGGFDFGAFQSSSLFLNVMLNPFSGGTAGSGSGPALAYAPAPKKTPATKALAYVDKATANQGFDGTGMGQHFRIWGSGFGGSGTIDGNPSTGAVNNDSRLYGFASGLGYQLSPDTVVGFALGGAYTHWSLDQGFGDGYSRAFKAGLYGSTRFGDAYLASALGYSLFDATTDRTVNVGGVSNLHGHFLANGLSGRLEGGYRLPFGGVSLVPYGAVQAQAIYLPSYTETATRGSSTYALSHGAQTATSARSELGAGLDYTYRLAGGASLKLYSRAAWAHDFNTSGTVTAAFQALPGPSFVVNSATPDADSALVTAGATYKLGDGWSFAAKFDGQFSGNSKTYSGTGAIRKVW